MIKSYTVYIGIGKLTDVSVEPYFIYVVQLERLQPLTWRILLESPIINRHLKNDKRKGKGESIIK